jgi:hypothetical protein
VEILWRGATKIALAVALAEAGRRVNLPIPIDAGELAASTYVGIFGLVEVIAGVGGPGEPPMEEETFITGQPTPELTPNTLTTEPSMN